MLVTVPHFAPIVAAPVTFERDVRLAVLEGWPSMTIGVRTTGWPGVRIPKSVEGVAATAAEAEPKMVTASKVRNI